jgi:mannosyltransferase OCH1-like enzyme
MMNHKYKRTIIIGIVACATLLLSTVMRRRVSWEAFLDVTDNAVSVPTLVKTLKMPPYSPTWRTDEVPKIIHQTAPADKSKWHVIWNMCQRTWFQQFPQHTYLMWTDEGVDDFIKTKYPAFYPTFRAYDKNIKRFDAVRYFLLYEYGGIYADMDYQCVKAFHHVLPAGKVSIAESMYAMDEGFQNALMASPPKHPFWLFVIDELLRRRDEEDVLYATGPLLIGQAVKDAPPDMFNGLPRLQFSHISTSARQSERKYLQPIHDPSVYAAHHCTSVYVGI